MAEWLRRWRLRDMKCIIHDLKAMSLNLGCVVILSNYKLNVNHKYQLAALRI